MKWIFSTILLAYLQILFASEYSINHYTIGDGLSHKSVIDIFRDSEGFLWISTTNGLNRFDGFTFKSLFADNKNSSSSGAYVIKQILESIDGTIWIASNEGISYFNKETEQFYNVQFPPSNKPQAIVSIAADDEGDIWACHEYLGLIKISKTNNTTVHVEKVNLNYLAINDNGFFNWKLLYSDGFLWFAGNPGLLRKNIITGEEKLIKISDKSLYFTNINKGNTNELILTSPDNGVYVYNTKTQNGFWEYTTANSNSSEKSNLIMDALRHPDGSLIVALSPGLIKVTKQETIQIHEIPEFKNELKKDISSTIYFDNEGILWIGTYNSGIFSAIPKSFKFKSSFSFDESFDPRAMIKTMHIFPDKSILYANLEGLFYSPDATNIELSSLKQITKNTVFHICPMDDENSVTINYNTISIFNKSNKTLKEIKKTAAVASVLYLDNIIWTGHWSLGLKGLDLQTGREYSFNVSDESALNNVFSIKAGKNGSLWLGTYGSGLVHIINPTSSSPLIKTYKHTDSIASISQNEIISLYNDNNGYIWLGTNGGNLNRIHIKTESVEVFKNLPNSNNNVIEAILSDNNGNLWFSSNVISKFNIKKNTLTHYTTTDGVLQEYNANVCQKLSDGFMFFGGNKGLSFFHPDSIIQRPMPSQPVFTDFRLFGLPVYPGDTIQKKVSYIKSITYSDTLLLPYTHNSFSIEFSNLLFRELESTRFDYKLEGIDRGWIPANSNSRMASYAGLQPGEYTFKLVSLNGDGLRSTPTKLFIKIIPPWWQTTWFKAALIVCIILLTFIIIRIRILRIKNDNKRLETLVLKRTNQLQSANVKLENQTYYLRESIKKLNEDKLFIEMKNEQLTESLTMKDKLISIIGHDFLNPLSSLQGYATLMLREAEAIKSQTINKYAGIIQSSAKTLGEQLVMVLNWAQGQTKDLKYNPVEINIEPLLNDSISLVMESAALKSITISTQFDYKKNAFIDTKMLSTVFRNLLTNAIKFTPSGGIISVMIQEMDTMLEVSFVDNGLGIAPDKLETIFDTSNETPSIGTHNEKGTGLGLQICKAFIEKNKGSIEIASEKDKGTTVTLLIPKGEEDAVREKLIQSTPTPEELFADTENINDNYSVLIIEDNTEILDVLYTSFSKLFHVIKATNAEKGWELAKQMLPDLIISDYHLPKMNGLELCTYLKNDKLTNHIPFFLVTSESAPGLEKESYSKGVSDFIKKPFDPFILRQKSLTVVEKRDKFKELIVQQSESKDTDPLPISAEDEILQSVLQIIKDNISDSEFGIDNITSEVGLSRAQLWRKVKSTTGKNPVDIIREMRLNKAAEMLRSGKYRISEVAYHVGFSDPKYFSNSFSKFFGESPSSYTKRFADRS